MRIRQTTASFSRRLRERVRSTLLNEPESASSRPTRGDGRGDGDGISDSFGNLFHCSRCSDVYIATEKRVCPECDEEVEQVRSTLACNAP
ncbi:hypothetical protein [Natrinema salaciae]|uniref:Small CPxCG-related zinc finger protein n=1 Tax=Natrinema salaciae TaxID=1186196 RepID=A0A1H9T3T7_9EURY|nr:hypothetical protein [Natrinema salaciae]SER91920.1 hypothetical protein SAMN04489841_0038 [Natrinema salaciae]